MIELKGIIEFKNKGHKYLDVVVLEDPFGNFKRHRVGVEVVASSGRIRAFLGQVYNVPPGKIVWPEHIRVLRSDNRMSLPP